ncbi:MAG: hypothetical protein ACJA1P_002607, partial [Maribacter sp.]
MFVSKFEDNIFSITKGLIKKSDFSEFELIFNSR